MTKCDDNHMPFNDCLSSSNVIKRQLFTIDSKITCINIIYCLFVLSDVVFSVLLLNLNYCIRQPHDFRVCSSDHQLIGW